MTTVKDASQTALFHSQRNEQIRRYGNPLLLAAVLLLASVAGVNSAFGQQAAEEEIDIAKFVRTAIPLNEIKRRH